MPNTRRVRQVVFDYLNDFGPSNTHEIYAHVNDRLRTGCVMNALSNLLAKDSRFEKLGREKVRGAYSHGHWVATWGLRDD